MTSEAKTDLRIISLIPSATEIVHALGCLDYLVGVSHECDYPPDVQMLPVCTAPNLDPHGSSQAIHARVSQLLQQALSIYRIDLDLIAQLKPTHIVTQAQCEVCAVSLQEVEASLQTLEACTPTLISLEPRTLNGVWQDIDRVGTILGVSPEDPLRKLKTRCQQLQDAVLPGSQPHKVVCIEWTDPLMAAGNWVPELVALAGGKPLLSRNGEHSAWMTWEDLAVAQPDVIIVMPCGFGLEATRAATQEMAANPIWATLPAVQNDAVYITDGNQYFNRPGPRLVDSLEILVTILNPSQARNQGIGWERFFS